MLKFFEKNGYLVSVIVCGLKLVCLIVDCDVLLDVYVEVVDKFWLLIFILIGVLWCDLIVGVVKVG